MPSSPEVQTPAAPPAAGNAIEHQVRAALTRATGSLSVGSGLLAAADWAMNLMVSPGKLMELALRAFEYAWQVARYDLECALAGPGEALARLAGPRPPTTLAQRRRTAAPPVAG
jgi:Poly-beta-hydroxybutyrate polymerase N terminal